MAKSKTSGRKTARATSKPGKTNAKPAAKKAASAPGKKRISWLDERSQTPLIEQYARQLRSFMGALADGVVDQAEVAAQEKRLVKLMKEIEPKLSDELHEKVTQLLCELTAYDLMQVLHSMHANRPKVAFRG